MNCRSNRDDAMYSLPPCGEEKIDLHYRVMSHKLNTLTSGFWPVTELQRRNACSLNVMRNMPPLPNFSYILRQGCSKNLALVRLKIRSPKVSNLFCHRALRLLWGPYEQCNR